MSDPIDRQAAIDTIYAEFEYVYCFNCDHEGNEEWCEDCPRKYMKWSASRNTIERVLNGLPSAQPEITDEQAIEHLQSTGWMQNHDREMYESGLRKQLADDSGSYDSLIPCEDTISRQAAIDSFPEDALAWDIFDGYVAPHYVRKILENLPSVQPEIIRCKDCKYVGTDATCCLVCNRDGMGLRPFHVYHDDFCSYAERRTDATD